MLWNRSWPFSIPPDQLTPRQLAFIEARMLAMTPRPAADGLADDDD